jgi:hypothetical protein
MPFKTNAYSEVAISIDVPATVLARTDEVIE